MGAKVEFVYNVLSIVCNCITSICPLVCKNLKVGSLLTSKWTPNDYSSLNYPHQLWGGFYSDLCPSGMKFCKAFSSKVFNP